MPNDAARRQSADAGCDMFLLVKGAKHGVIKGESQDQAHRGEIDVSRWSWGMEAKPALGAGGGSSKATVHELHVVKRVDSASTALLAALRTNEPLQKAVLTVRKAGETQLEFLRITIEQGRITSLTIDAGEVDGGPELIEHLSLSFNKVLVEYVPQGSDGQSQATMTYADQWGGT